MMTGPPAAVSEHEATPSGRLVGHVDGVSASLLTPDFLYTKTNPRRFSHNVCVLICEGPRAQC